MRNIFYFDNMLTPKIITLVYWCMLLAALFSGLGVMFGGYGGFSVKSLFLGALYMLGGAIAARIWCELLIVLFKMNEALQDLRRHSDKASENGREPI